METKQLPLSSDKTLHNWYFIHARGKVPQKRSLTNIEKILYWLDWGRNPDALYEPHERHPFTQTVHDTQQQALLMQGLETAVSLHGGKLQKEYVVGTTQDSPQVRVISAVTKRRGNPAVVIRFEDSVQHVDHTWVNTPIREERLR